MYMPPKTTDFVPPPEGSHLARCYRVIDLGTQQEDFQGQIKMQRKILVTWELYCDERMDDGRPFTIGKKYTLSSHEKGNLRKDLEAWRGRKFEDADFGPGGFSIEKLIGVPCMLAVTHKESKGSVYANISAIMGVPKGTTVPALENKTVYFSMESATDFSPDVYESLTDGLKKIITASPEWAELHKPQKSAPHASGDNEPPPYPDEDIPF